MVSVRQIQVLTQYGKSRDHQSYYNALQQSIQLLRCFNQNHNCQPHGNARGGQYITKVIRFHNLGITNVVLWDVMANYLTVVQIFQCGPRWTDQLLKMTGWISIKFTLNIHHPHSWNGFSLDTPLTFLIYHNIDHLEALLDVLI